MTRAVLIAVAAGGLLGAAPAPPPFRIAVEGLPTAPCAAPSANLPAAEKAYYSHLSARLGRIVERCAFANETEAAAALAEGRVDLARLTPESYPAVAAKVRAAMTVRSRDDTNRIPIFVAVRTADPARDLTGLKGRAIAFGGVSSANMATPKAVLAQRGLAEGSYRSDVAHDGDAALADLRAGRADAAAVHAAAWQRVCRMVSPKDPNPCRDLRVLVTARPRADQALAVRRDMPDDQRYRLLGILLPLHLENPAAFSAAAAGLAKDPAEFQPAEAEALTLAPLK